MLASSEVVAVAEAMENGDETDIQEVKGELARKCRPSLSQLRDGIELEIERDKSLSIPVDLVNIHDLWVVLDALVLCWDGKTGGEEEWGEVETETIDYLVVHPAGLHPASVHSSELIYSL